MGEWDMVYLCRENVCEANMFIWLICSALPPPPPLLFSLLMMVLVVLVILAGRLNLLILWYSLSFSFFHLLFSWWWWSCSQWKFFLMKLTCSSGFAFVVPYCILKKTTLFLEEPKKDRFYAVNRSRWVNLEVQTLFYYHQYFQILSVFCFCLFII